MHSPHLSFILLLIGGILASSCQRNPSDLEIVRQSGKDLATRLTLGSDRVFNAAERAFQQNPIIGKTSKEITDMFGRPTSVTRKGPWDEVLVYAYNYASTETFCCTITVISGRARKVVFERLIQNEG